MNIQKMMQQAQQMQERMQKQMAETVIEASAGGGAVSVKVNGSKEVLGITIDPVSNTGRGPHRSDRVPQTMLAHAIARKPTVIALDTPATDQPVSRVMA